MTEAPLNHPGDEALRALSLGQLTEAELTHVSAHLADCPDCCRRIDQLDTDDRFLTRVQRSAARGKDLPITRAQRRSAVRALRQAHEAKSAREKRASEAVPIILPIPKQVGDYDILEEVGRGGMGVVYKARHRGLHRLAALKMVLAGEFASPSQELRFRLEAELAARVQHPNIVQVYEIGSYEGRPFLVLEWVEGGSLAQRLDGKPWPAVEAAALIETLARAIDVAHNEGVVHRDLKPANILLQKEEGGRMKEESESALLSSIHPPSASSLPKITDFGLAQTIEGGQTVTQSGFLVGTPGYMAPEQAGGKRALVGPATDIYALGVVLYQLITGQLPFKADSTLELLRVVTSDEPTRPRRLQPGVPRDLEAITLHCLEKKPGSRYPTALALAEDLRRFQEGKHVVARSVGEIERLWRWFRRKPVIAGLLAALVLAVGLGLFGVSWAYFVAEAARQAEKEKRLEADEQRERAEKARDRTRQALDAMTSSLTGDSLTTQNEISDEQKRFLTEVLTYYQEFAGEKTDDEPSRSRTAEAALRVGLIENRLGRKAEAESANRAAWDGYAKLIADFPAKPEYRNGLAGCHVNVGNVLKDLDKWLEAEEQYREALAILEKLAAEFPALPEYRHRLVITRHNLGDLVRKLGKATEAVEQYRKAVAIGEKLADDFPVVPEYRWRLATNHSQLGDVLRELGKSPQAEAEFRKALTLQEKLATDFPAEPEYRHGLACSHFGLGILLIGLGKVPEGEEQYRKALALQVKLAAEFPIVAAYRDSQASIRTNLGVVLTAQAKWPEAEEQHRKAMALRQKLAADFPAVPDYRYGLASSHFGQGNLLIGLGKMPEGEEQYRKALALQEKLALDFPAVPKYREQQANTRMNLGLVLVRLGKWREGDEQYRKALTLQEKLAADFLAEPEYSYGLALSHFNLGILLIGLGKMPEGEEQYRKALALQEKLALDFPAVPKYREQQTNSRINLGVVLVGLGKWREGEEQFRKGLTLLEKLAADFPAASKYVIRQGGVSCNLGILAITSNRPPGDSLVWFEKAIRTLTTVYEQDRQLAEATQFLRNSYLGRAKAYGLVHKYAEAVRDLDRAVELSPNKEQPEFRAQRSSLRIMAGQVAEAVAEVAELSKTSHWDSGQWYSFACVYAVASGKFDDKNREYADRAMELLQQAVKVGYRDAAHIKQDSDLDSLRGRDDFKQLLAELAK